MWLIIPGAVLTVGGAVTTVVYFFQPWRTCPGVDDAPDACPMLPLDNQIMSVAMLVTLIGVIVLTLGIVLQVTRASRVKAKVE